MILGITKRDRSFRHKGPRRKSAISNPGYESVQTGIPKFCPHRTNGLQQVKDLVVWYKTKMMYPGSALNEALKPNQDADE
jgi:hypothetical protein